MIGSWLPSAVYWLGATMLRAWGAQAPDSADAYRSWGLDGLAEEASEARTDLGLAAFGLGPDGLDNRDHGHVPAGVRKPGVDAPEHSGDEQRGGNEHPDEKERGDGRKGGGLGGTNGEELEEIGVRDEEDAMRNGPQGPRAPCDEARPEHALEPAGSFETHGGIVAAP